jgi:hypothetical protein
LPETPLVANVGPTVAVDNCQPKTKYTSKPRHIHHRAVTNLVFLPIGPRIHEPRRHSLNRFAAGT